MYNGQTGYPTNQNDLNTLKMEFDSHYTEYMVKLNSIKEEERK